MADSDNMLTLDKQLCFAVYAAGHAFTRFYKPRLDALGLTYPQYLTMLVLWETDGITVKAIGEQLFLDSGTTTPLLKRLEAQGYVRRQRDDEDERRVRVFLTPLGKEMREVAMLVPLQVVGATGMGQDAMARLKGELDDLRRRLDRM